MSEFEKLKGKTLTKVDNDYTEIVFTCSDGSVYTMFHSQDCCETVSVEDINGDWEDIIGEEILVADEKVQDDENASESGTFTFYTIRTHGASIDIRWYGSSNGYYSESVDFVCTQKPLLENFGPLKF